MEQTAIDIIEKMNSLFQWHFGIFTGCVIGVATIIIGASVGFQIWNDNRRREKLENDIQLMQDKLKAIDEEISGRISVLDEKLNGYEEYLQNNIKHLPYLSHENSGALNEIRGKLDTAIFHYGNAVSAILLMEGRGDRYKLAFCMQNLNKIKELLEKIKQSGSGTAPIESTKYVLKQVDNAILEFSEENAQKLNHLAYEIKELLNHFKLDSISFHIE